MEDTGDSRSYVTLGEALEPFKERVITRVFDGQKPKRGSPDSAKLDYLALAELYASQVKVPERQRFKFGGSRTVLQKANSLMKQLTDPTEKRSRAGALQKAFPNQKVKDLNLITMPLSDRGAYVDSLMKQGAITEFRKRGSVATPSKTSTSGAGAGAGNEGEEEKDGEDEEEDDEVGDVITQLQRTKERIESIEEAIKGKSTPELTKMLQAERELESRLQKRLESLGSSPTLTDGDSSLTRIDDDISPARIAERLELANSPFKVTVSEQQRDEEEDWWASQDHRQDEPIPPLPSPSLTAAGQLSNEKTAAGEQSSEVRTPVVTATAIVSGVTTRPAAATEAAVIERGVDNDVTAIESNIAEGKVVNSEAMLVTAVEETGGAQAVDSIEGAKDKMAKQKDTQEDETQVEEAERLAVNQASNAVQNRDAKEQAGAIAGVGMVARTTASEAAAGGETLADAAMTLNEIEQLQTQWFRENPDARELGKENPWSNTVRYARTVQASNDAVGMRDPTPETARLEAGTGAQPAVATDAAERDPNMGDPAVGNMSVGAQGQGDASLVGQADTDYAYDLPAFLGESGGAGGAPQVGAAVMDKLQGAQGAMAAIDKAADNKGIDALKRDIEALCYLFQSIVPALKSQEFTREKRMVLSSRNRATVVAFYKKTMAAIKGFYESDQLKVGVIVSGSGGGTGGGGGGGLPGLGTAGYSAYKHSNDEFQNMQRGQQHINRGGRNWNRPIENRIPMSLPNLKPKPAKLSRTLGFPNVPFPNIRRAYNTGASYSLR